MASFDSVKPDPVDPIFGLITAFQKDARADKVNLTVGYYRNEQLQTPVLQCVQEVEKKLAEAAESKQYLPIEGDREFIFQSGRLLFGDKLWTERESAIAGFQAVGGTGALRIGGDFLKKEIGNSLYISNPTWPNHRSVFLHAGMRVEEYPYYDFARQKLDFDALRSFFSSLPEKSVILLHTCCHNPTGADLSKEQWEELSELFISKKLIPFFDTAYQGFGDDADMDAYPVRLFLERGLEMAVAVSYAKNFSLYCERVGALFFVCRSSQSRENVVSVVRTLIRAQYSNPPRHGARIVGEVLKSAHLKSLWQRELKEMRERIHSMRSLLAKALIAESSKRDYSYLLGCKGLFCFTGLSKEQIHTLIEKCAIYMTQDGRLNVAGINRDNLDRIVKGILLVE